MSTQDDPSTPPDGTATPPATPTTATTPAPTPLQRRRKIGQPTKLTQEFQDQLVNLLERGQAGEVAAQHLGIHPATFYLWMERGRNGESKALVSFFDAVTRARATGEAALLEIISKKAHGPAPAKKGDERKTSAEWAAWLLIHRWRGRYSDRGNAQLEDGVAAVVNRLRGEFAKEPEILARIFAAIAGFGSVRDEVEGGSGEAVQIVSESVTAGRTSGEEPKEQKP